MHDIPTRYNPKEFEEKWYRFWEEKNFFHAEPKPDKKPFCIVIPPPNITGILHMGHALNNTLQDILIRYKRMQGYSSLWMPGTDHAGIATQNVVEKQIAKEGLKRQDLGRDKFLEKVWQWQKEYGSTIIHQLKKLGSSCDWERTRFTMDEEYSKAVKDVFVALWKKGLIYQDDKVINWCPRCQTALSDEEAPHREIQGNMYYIKYPVKKSIVNSPQSIDKTMDHGPRTIDYIVVATTRPETMLGDSAVAVNPKDKRYKNLIDKTLILPLVNREIKIIADNIVDMKFGTGAVKVTPAHDPNDYILGKKHNLEFVNVMHPDGRMNEMTGSYKDMDRFEAREVILEDLKEKGLVEKIEPHKLSAGHCYRCHTIIEPYLSKQWFVKTKPLAKPAIEAVKKGKIKFYPKRWTKVYYNWMENIQDWCISRQIWWGHRLPVYYCKNCQAGKFPACAKASAGRQIPNHRKEAGIIVSKIRPEKCPVCGSTDIYQDEDVLDTWFSSWLWPFATFKEKRELEYFYPTSVLVTASEIIFFWVARMIMAGMEFMKDIPFEDAYIHGTVRDIEGKKMSKSLGNIIDPVDIINEYGADALRFSLISITAQGQDVYLSKEKFEQGRNFANKIWNASRFILMNLDASQIKVDLCVFFKKEHLDIINAWILSRFYSTLKDVNKMLDAYRFNEAANLLYDFFWHEFCDWYLELTKPILIDKKDTPDYRNTQVVMYKVLEKFLRVMHPFMPFITEEIWQRIPHEGESIIFGPWPHIQEQIIDKKIEKRLNLVFEAITAIRNIRAEMEIAHNIRPDAIISCKDNKDIKFLETQAQHIKNLARINNVMICKSKAKPSHAASAVFEDFKIYLLLEGKIDIGREISRLQKKKDEIDALLKNISARLKNKEFINKAPAEVVNKEKEKLTSLKKKSKAIADIRKGLK